jgi:hypothetical protein
MTEHTLPVMLIRALYLGSDQKNKRMYVQTQVVVLNWRERQQYLLLTYFYLWRCMAMTRTKLVCATLISAGDRSDRMDEIDMRYWLFPPIP